MARPGDSADEAIARIRSCSSSSADHGGSNNLLVVANKQVLYPLVQGCETKDPKMVRMCLGVMQKLITNKVVNFEGAALITDRLWMLMECGIEEVKIVQTLTLLLTSSHVVQVWPLTLRWSGCVWA